MFLRGKFHLALRIPRIAGEGVQSRDMGRKPFTRPPDFSTFESVGDKSGGLTIPTSTPAASSKPGLQGRLVTGRYQEDVVVETDKYLRPVRNGTEDQSLRQTRPVRRITEDQSLHQTRATPMVDYLRQRLKLSAKAETDARKELHLCSSQSLCLGTAGIQYNSVERTLISWLASTIPNELNVTGLTRQYLDKSGELNSPCPLLERVLRQEQQVPLVSQIFCLSGVSLMDRDVLSQQLCRFDPRTTQQPWLTSVSEEQTPTINLSQLGNRSTGNTPRKTCLYSVRKANHPNTASRTAEACSVQGHRRCCS